MQQVLQLDLAVGWTFGVKWSPSGNSLAYVGASSTSGPLLRLLGKRLFSIRESYKSIPPFSEIGNVLSGPRCSQYGSLNLTTVSSRVTKGLESSALNGS